MNYRGFMQKIVFITFLNDYSGSPKMLSLIVKDFIKRGYNVEIITNHNQGHLSNIARARYSYVHYRYVNNNKFLTLIYFIIVQIELFFKILFWRSTNTVFYINTITPIGAAWACKLSKKRYIYHVHENMNLKRGFYPIYKFTYRFCNKKTIFVSNFLARSVTSCNNYKVIYNCLDDDFINSANKYRQLDINKRKTILLISSFRRYKGVYTFIELARKLPQYKFEMVLSSSAKEVNELINKENIPNNIEIHPISTFLHPYYSTAKLLLSLTNPEYRIETFGLTILEAMSYGIPAIVPNIGGPTELIKNGVNGFCLDVTNISELVKYIKLLMEDKNLYSSFASASFNASQQYSCSNMMNQIEEYIYG